MRNNIDDILKESLGDFKPEAPVDAWQGIQQGLGQLPAAGAAVKATSLLTKIVMVVTVPAIIAGSYFAYKALSTPDEKVLVNITTPATQPETPVSEVPETQTEPTLNAGNAKETIKEQALPEPKTSVPVVKVKPAPTHSTSGTGVGNNEKPVTPASNPDVSEAPVATPAPPVPVKVKEPVTKSGSKPKARNQYYRNPPEESKPVVPVNDEEKVVVPNVFTPNNDGHNDRFVIPVENEIVYYLKIVDKHDRIVFESSDRGITWDGTIMNNGENCEPGFYSYVFKYQLRDDAEPHYSRGKVQIIR